MSENINLIPVTELPVAEGNGVEVLCIENGELKKKTTENEYDLDIVITLNLDNSPPPTVPHEVKRLADYATLKSKIQTGESIRCRVTFLLTLSGLTMQVNYLNDALCSCFQPVAGDDPELIAFTGLPLPMGLDWSVMVLVDNTTAVYVN